MTGCGVARTAWVRARVGNSEAEAAQELVEGRVVLGRVVPWPPWHSRQRRYVIMGWLAA